MTHHEQGLVEALERIEREWAPRRGARRGSICDPHDVATAALAAYRTAIASQPPTLDPVRTAREVAHDALGDSCGERFGHTKYCDSITASIEADRLSRPEVLGRSGNLAGGLDAKTVEACAQEVFSWDIDWSVGIPENLGKLGLRIRSLASTPPDVEPTSTQQESVGSNPAGHPTGYDPKKPDGDIR